MAFIGMMLAGATCLGYGSLIIFLLYKYTKHHPSCNYRYIYLYSLFVAIDCTGSILYDCLYNVINDLILTFLIIPMTTVPVYTAYSIVAIMWHEIYLKHISILISESQIFKSSFNKSIIYLNILSLTILYLLSFLIYFQIIPSYEIHGIPLAIRFYDLLFDFIVNGIVTTNGFKTLKVIRRHYTEKPKKLITYIYLCIILLSLRTLVSLMCIIALKSVDEIYL